MFTKVPFKMLSIPHSFIVLFYILWRIVSETVKYYTIHTNQTKVSLHLTVSSGVIDYFTVHFFILQPKKDCLTTKLKTILVNKNCSKSSEE